MWTEAIRTLYEFISAVVKNYFMELFYFSIYQKPKSYIFFVNPRLNIEGSLMGPAYPGMRMTKG